MERIKYSERKRRVSWGSIFGGLVTVLSISVLLSILAASIGLFQFDPTSDQPGSGIGATVGIFTVLSLLISFAAGGFVAGKLAGADGIIHGFIVWATTLIVTVVFAAFLTVGAVRLTSNILGSVSSMAGSVLSGVGSVVESGVSGLANQAENVFGDIDLSDEIDGSEIRQDVRQALRRSGVRELQPEFIQRELRGVRNDLKKSVRRLVSNPNDADKVISSFGDRLQERGEKFTNNIDRQDITRAIANNTNLSQAEVERAVDEYIELFENMREQGREQIENLQQSIDEAKQQWEEMKQQALVEAEKATNAAGRAALISFFALLVGAGVSCLCGHFGTRTTKEGYEV